MNIGVLGFGDVGKAISKLCQQKHQVFIKDLDKNEFTNQTIDILHVCIPWNSKFENIISKEIKSLNPKLTIISSTVKPGATQNLYKKTNTLLVHAPVIGVHPHLYKSLKTFTKPLGAVNSQAFLLAQKHFKELGVKVIRFDSPFETELAKIFSTTYYAWNILFEKWLHRVSQKTHTNFDQVYTQWNQIYNAGYKKSKPNVIRPILKHSPGPIGGHCLIPNAKIIDEWLNDAFSNFIISQDKNSQS